MLNIPTLYLTFKLVILPPCRIKQLLMKLVSTHLSSSALHPPPLLHVLSPLQPSIIFLRVRDGMTLLPLVLKISANICAWIYFFMFLGKKSDKLKKLLENTEKKIDGWMDGDVNICKSSALVISFYLFLRTVFEL